MAEQQERILMLRSPDKATENTAIRSYLEAEDEKIAAIHKRIVQQAAKLLDYRDLFPEHDFGSKLVGVYDPVSFQNDQTDFALSQFLPFYEIVLCPIRVERCMNEDRVQKLYGCTLKDLLELADMGKILPLLPSNPYLKEEAYRLFLSFYEKGFPTFTRYAYVIQHDMMDLLKSSPETARAFKEVQEITIHAFSRMNKTLKIPHPFDTKAFLLISRAISRWDFGLGFKYMDYVDVIMSDSPGDPERAEWMISGLDDIDQWHQQPYFAGGAAGNYSGLVMEAIQTTTKDLGQYVQAGLNQLPAASQAVLRGSLDLTERGEAFCADALAILGRRFFYEPPACYDSPVRLAKWLERSGLIREHYSIAKRFTEEIEQGDIRGAASTLSRGEYQKRIDEIAREIQSLERSADILKLSMAFGAATIGALGGAVAGAALSAGQLSALFASVGAAAAASLTTQHSETIAKKVLLPGLRRRNTALAIWQLQDKERE